MSSSGIGQPADERSAEVAAPDDAAIVPELEDDETIPPRPEEEIADALRAEPDVADHTI